MRTATGTVATLNGNDDASRPTAVARGDGQRPAWSGAAGPKPALAAHKTGEVCCRCHSRLGPPWPLPLWPLLCRLLPRWPRRPPRQAWLLQQAGHKTARIQPSGDCQATLPKCCTARRCSAKLHRHHRQHPGDRLRPHLAPQTSAPQVRNTRRFRRKDLPPSATPTSRAQPVQHRVRLRLACFRAHRPRLANASRDNWVHHRSCRASQRQGPVARHRKRNPHLQHLQHHAKQEQAPHTPPGSRL
mmetsp:Transcript_98431/g.249846  ORF Transcript_98431/g.249846 Transcript_98431/m.249846 type:complete len:244 (+) Transcript_98431:902-1633(+)